MYKINNLRKENLEHNFIVARFVGDELWYWGAYDDEARAQAVAEEIRGVYFPTAWVTPA